MAEIAPVLTLSWNRPQVSGATAIQLGASSLSRISDAGTQFLGYDAVQVLPLPQQGIVLGLYTFRANGSVIGHGVRYRRNASISYTRADVMLVRWDPLH